MKIAKSRFQNVMKQAKEMVENGSLKANGNIVEMWGYSYIYTVDKNKVKIELHDAEDIELNFIVNEDNVEILESICNGKKCKSDKTLKKFEILVASFYPLYELKVIK